MNRRSFLGMITIFPIAIAGSQASAKGKSSGPKNLGGSSNYRSAKSGQYVKKNYADKNPSTTVKERKK